MVVFDYVLAFERVTCESMLEFLLLLGHTICNWALT